MDLDNSEWKAVNKAINQWLQESKLTTEQADNLRNSFTIKKANQQVAHYFFLIALSCSLLAFGAIFIDERLLERIRAYFSLSNFTIALIMGLFAASWFYYINKRFTIIKNVTYEFYMVLGGLASITSLVYICKDFGFGPSYSGFLLITTLLLFTLSILFRSKALWLSMIAALMGWFGAFSYAYGQDHFFLGMNYPVRFTLFGLVVIGVASLQKRIEQLKATQRITYISGLIIFFTGMWGVSVFGNYHELEEWLKVRQSQVIIYGIVFGIAALFALYLGVTYKDDLLRDLGILFLLINLYTRYFEYFWNSMHKGIFFLILAVSFWLVGKQIEKTRKKKEGAT